MTAEELAFFNAKLATCTSRLTVLDRLLSDIGRGVKNATVDYLNGRREEWLTYKAGLLLVRDNRPDKQTTGSNIEV